MKPLNTPPDFLEPTSPWRIRQMMKEEGFLEKPMTKKERSGVRGFVYRLFPWLAPWRGHIE
ncbi:MAG TPA: hypothetical protein VF473_02645 [Cyclobacteriaceae bacterium]